MPLKPGARVGPHEIVGALGAGGMGEVYRARDTQLNRDVAIKVLPELFAVDHERLARFTREAQTLASLNHPSIAQIYGLEGDGSRGRPRALVMELVDGEDLSAIIDRGAVPLSDALPIVRQIADALEAAHEVGIIHRDLKPANVKVRPDGTVKVLDFGLAKAIDPAGTSSADAMKSPTLTAHATQMGTIIGTAAYMAPEQARGRTLFPRVDVIDRRTVSNRCRRRRGVGIRRWFAGLRPPPPGSAGAGQSRSNRTSAGGYRRVARGRVGATVVSGRTPGGGQSELRRNLGLGNGPRR